MRGIVLLAVLLIAPVAWAGAVPAVGVYSSSPAELARTRLAHGGYQAHDVPFPAVGDPASLRITLERGPCFGECPIYKVEVRGDGSVFYKGEGFVAGSGHHRATIPKESVDPARRGVSRSALLLPA